MPSRLLTRRWLSVFLRALHLPAVIGLGAVLHGAVIGLPIELWTIAVLVTGSAMYGLDLLNRLDYWREVAGIGIVVKLGLVAVMLLNEPLRLPIFWFIVFWSAVFSHAPASFRHRRIG